MAFAPTAFAEYCNRLQHQHGEKFSDVGLAHKFRPYFRSGQRIKVRFSYGEVKTGTVSGTTGWQPSLMLMLRSNSMGSSHLLSDRDEIIAVQNSNGKGYRSLILS